jgi:hypothetical protein
MTDETIRGFLDYLPTIRGLKGYTLQAGKRLLVNQLPAQIHGTGEGVGQLIADFLNAYHEYQRPVQQACFETVEGILVVLREPPPQAPLPPPAEPVVISLIAADPSVVSVITATATALLERCSSRIRTMSTEAFDNYNVPPDSDWTYFKADVLVMMSKVVGSAQSERLLSRVMADLGLDRNLAVKNTQFRRLGDALVAAVPNKSRQEFLKSELEHLLADYA